IWRFGQTGKISWVRSVNSRSTESNSNSRITRSHIRFISAIPTVTSSRLRPTKSISDARPSVMSSEVETPLEIAQFDKAGNLARDLIRSLPIRSAFGVPVYLAAPSHSVLDFSRNGKHGTGRRQKSGSSQNQSVGLDIYKLSGSGVSKIWEL